MINKILKPACAASLPFAISCVCAFFNASDAQAAVSTTYPEEFVRPEFRAVVVSMADGGELQIPMERFRIHGMGDVLFIISPEDCYMYRAGQVKGFRHSALNRQPVRPHRPVAPPGKDTPEPQWIHVFLYKNRVNTGLLADFDSISYMRREAPDSYPEPGDSADPGFNFPGKSRRRAAAGSDDEGKAEGTLFDRILIGRGGNVEEHLISSVDSIVVGTNVPTLRIDTEGGLPVTSKENYLDATISLTAYGAYDDFPEQSVGIRGRGNSTWQYPKKPYRLKFSKKQSLCGMAKAKSYVLLANQLDWTLLRNSTSMEVGRILGMDYVNTMVPVNLVFNGEYAGAYVLTEKVGINSGSVDIDEEEGILFEMDTAFDEPYEFHSGRFGLPVMVKDPDFEELAGDNPELGAPDGQLERWKKDFERMEKAIGGASDDDITDLLDYESLAKYLMTFNVTGNHEVQWPKSVYLYKKSAGDKYHFGPLWDFDWAFNFPMNDAVYQTERPLLQDSQLAGDRFFRALVSDPRFMETYRAIWDSKKDELLTRLMEHIDASAAAIRVSAMQNATVWPEQVLNDRMIYSSADIKGNVEILKKWLRNRIAFIDSDPNMGLF